MADKGQRFKNTQKAYLPSGYREDIAPFAITRAYTQDEIDKSPDLRRNLDEGYLVPYDGPSPAKKKIELKKADYTLEPGSHGSQSVKHKTATGIVEYVTADPEGVDGVLSADPEVIATIPKHKPADYIEPGLSGRNADGTMKTTIQKPVYEVVSEAREKALAEEQAELTMEDDGDLDALDGPEVPDAEDEIEADFKQALARSQGEIDTAKDFQGEKARNEVEVETAPAPAESGPNPFTPSKVEDIDDVESDETRVLRNDGKDGATLVSVKDEVLKGVSKGTAALEEALKENVDNGEKIEGVSERAGEFLSQDFGVKKYSISKETDAAFLTEVAGATKSDNVRSLAEQRLEELKAE